MPDCPHAVAGYGACPQRQLQLQRQKRTHRLLPGRRPLRLQLRQHRQPQDGTGTGRRTLLCDQRIQPAHRHRRRKRTPPLLLNTTPRATRHSSLPQGHLRPWPVLN